MEEAATESQGGKLLFPGLRIPVICSVVAMLLAGSALAALPMKIVDSGAGPGANPDLAFDTNGEIVVVYRHQLRTLKLARVGCGSALTGEVWVGNSPSEWTSLAVDTMRAAHISHVPLDPILLAYTLADAAVGTNPITVGIPNTSGVIAPVLAIDSVDRPYIAFHVRGQPRLASFDISSGTWQIETIPSANVYAAQSYHRPITVEVNSQDEPVVAYSALNNQIVVATRSPLGWSMRHHSVTSSPGTVSLAIDTGDIPHVACVVDNELRVYRFHLLGVSQETAVAGSMTLSPHSMRLDTAGHKCIAYWDPGSKAFYIAVKNYAWFKTLIEQVPGAADTQSCSLAIDRQNRWAITYVDDTGQVKVAGPGVRSPSPGDADCDEIPDAADNCPQQCNPGQEDFDGDSIGDSCDNCRSIPDPDQGDIDQDGIGDCCDRDLPDSDNDGVHETCDNCPLAPNPDQTDGDNDQIGDGCDQCPNTIPGIAVDVYGCPPLIPGDFDRDGDVDAGDISIFDGCYSGPAVPHSGGDTCVSADFDSDDDVDQSDFGMIQRWYSGENNPAGSSNTNPAVLAADHLAASEFDLISDAAIAAIQARFRIFFGHTSHGSQIVTGMEMLQAADARFAFNAGSGTLTIQEVNGDLGTLGDTTWATTTREQLNQAGNSINLVIWSWCWGVSENTPAGIDVYLQTMSQLERDYPNVAFVYMTGHLDGTGPSGNLEARNSQIRDYCIANNKILFDFADIESYDPANNNYPDGSDACEWCTSWCAAHSCPTCGLCAHSHCFNCYRKGRAFWWLLGRITGWSGG